MIIHIFWHRIPIHAYGIFLHLFSSSLNFLSNVPQLSLQEFGISLCRFHSKYFIFFKTVLNDVKIVFSQCLMLANRMKSVFVHWFLYPVVSLNLLFLTFLVESLRFSMCKIMLSATRDNFIFTFLIWMSLVCFSSLNA